MFEITREEYVPEVTEVSKETFVVLHLYQDYIEECVLMNRILEQLAEQYPNVKFVKIVATVSQIIRFIEMFREVPRSQLSVFLDL